MTGSFRSRLWALKRQQLLRSKDPILVGPWLSEVGFEALYWLPFLARLVHDGLDPARLIPISRGGAAAWYGTEQGLEIYAMRSPQDVRVEMRQRLTNGYDSVKQLTWSPFERQLVKDAAETMKLRRYQTLHPLWMYHSLAPYWEAERGLAWLQQRTGWNVIQAPPLPDALTLPEKFIAVRFYRRPTFTERAIPMAQACVRQLALQVPVVVLHSDFFADDHSDLAFTGENILQLRDLTMLNPETNLAVQSAVVAHAIGFVGTYGGFAQLALRLGKPVVSYYDQWDGTMITHRHLADTIATMMRVPWTVLGLEQFPLVQAAMPIIQQAATV